MGRKRNTEKKLAGNPYRKLSLERNRRIYVLLRELRMRLNEIDRKA